MQLVAGLQTSNITSFKLIIRKITERFVLATADLSGQNYGCVVGWTFPFKKLFFFEAFINHSVPKKGHRGMRLIVRRK